MSTTRVIVETDPTTLFVGINVAPLFNLYRAGLAVPVSAVSPSGGILRVDHAADAGLVDTCVYRTPDPTDPTQHWGRDPDSVPNPGRYAGPFQLPVLPAPP